MKKNTLNKRKNLSFYNIIFFNINKNFIILSFLIFSYLMPVIPTPNSLAEDKIPPEILPVVKDTFLKIKQAMPLLFDYASFSGITGYDNKLYLTVSFPQGMILSFENNTWAVSYSKFPPSTSFNDIWFNGSLIAERSTISGEKEYFRKCSSLWEKIPFSSNAGNYDIPENYRKSKHIWNDGLNEYIIGENGTIFINGKKINPITDENLNAIWGNDDGDVFIVGDKGTLIQLGQAITNEDSSLIVANFIKSLDEYEISLSCSSSDKTILPDENIILYDRYPTNYTMTTNNSWINVPLTIIPAENQNGIVFITISADYGANITTKTFSLTINQVNDLPAITNITKNLNYYKNDMSILVSENLNLIDVDNEIIESASVIISSNFQSDQDELTCTNAGNITGIFLNNTLILSGHDTYENYQKVLRSVKYNNLNEVPYAAERNISYFVNDGSSESQNTSIASVKIMVYDKPEMIIEPYNYTALASAGSILYTVSSNGAGQWEAKAMNDWLNIEGNKTGIDNGNFKINYTANSGEKRSGNILISAPGAANFPVMVNIIQEKNTNPFISDISQISTNEDMPITIPFYVFDKETNINNITFSIESSNTELISNNACDIDKSYISNSTIENCAITITPSSNLYGSSTITLTVFDSLMASYSRTFILEVYSSNDSPQFVSSAIPIIYEDDGEKRIKIAENIEPGPFNESGQQWIIQLNPSSSSLFAIGPDVTPDGIMSFTTAQNAYGSAVFNVSVQDDGGTDNGGNDTSKVQKMTIVVVPVNDCPSFQIVDNHTVFNWDGEQHINNWATNISPGQNEEDQSIAFNVLTNNDSLFSKAPSISSDGTLNYSPVQDKTGKAIISVYLKDSGGIEYDGCDSSSSQDFTITVMQTRYKLTILQQGKGAIKVNDLNILPEWNNYYNAGSEINLAASPETDWSFAYWYGSFTNSSKEITVSMNEDITITAAFFEQPIDLTLYGKGQIKINSIIYDLPISLPLIKNTNIILEPVPSDSFLRWSGDLTGNNIIENITLQKDTTIIVHYIDPYDWSVNINAEAENLGGKYQDEIVAGVGIISETQPAQLTSLFSCNMVIYASESNILSKQIFQDNSINNYISSNTYKWIIAINPHGNIPPIEERTAKISWNPSQFSPIGYYRLIKGYEEQEKEVVISDMRTVTEFNVTGENSDQYFTLVWSDNELFEFFLLSGWNLISLPLIPDDPRVDILFPEIDSVYEYKGGSYAHATVLKPGQGYFIKVSQDKKFIITGKPFSKNHIQSLNKGWYLLGTINQNTIPMTKPINSIEIIYQYFNGNYSQVTEFRKGKGYWVKISKKTDFILDK